MEREIKKIVENTVGDINTKDQLCVVCEYFLRCLLSTREKSSNTEINTNFIINSLKVHGLDDIAVKVKCRSIEIQREKKKRAMENLKKAPYVSRNMHISFANLLLEDESQKDRYEILIHQK